MSIWDDGTQGNGHSELPSISDDGRRIVFASEATNLSSDDTNGELDIYLHDREPTMRLLRRTGRDRHRAPELHDRGRGAVGTEQLPGDQR